MSCQVGQSQAAQGLIVSVLRNGQGDFSRGGLTADHQELTVVNVDGPFGPADDRPAVMLIQGPGAKSNPVLVPAIKNEAGDWQPAPGWWMFGGNYAVTGDSRFGEALGRLGATRGMAPKVHDRIEASDVEVSRTGSDGASVVIGTLRRRGMTWIALDQHGGTLSRHDSEAGAVDTIEVAAGVKR
jgi:hypothetical protein